ncbi:MAG: hypothetical protein J6Y58_03135 [Clostridiales bacterium]|nr:hypothetical protein [Clostridiales bacterium]
MKGVSSIYDFVDRFVIGKREEEKTRGFCLFEQLKRSIRAIGYREECM